MADAASPKPVSLALQGGGAHGAFTWGVLDFLIEDGRLAFDAISGTSAGAMNAVVVADGLSEGGPEGARKQLAAFWRGVSRDAGTIGAAHDVLGRILGFWQLPRLQPLGLAPLAALASPYDFNPLNINPLRGLLDGLIDFERVRRSPSPRLFVSATDVRSGKIRVFSGSEVTADAVLASAALPYLFQAVAGAASDILLVQVNPVRREDVPRTPSEIIQRIAEITFNASLLRELRAIEFVNRLIDEHRLDLARYRRNRLHRIDATDALAHRAGATKLDTSWRFFTELHEAGRAAAKDWLDAHFDDIGVRATFELRHEFL